jgi:putative transposase
MASSSPLKKVSGTLQTSIFSGFSTVWKVPDTNGTAVLLVHVGRARSTFQALWLVEKWAAVIKSPQSGQLVLERDLPWYLIPFHETFLDALSPTQAKEGLMHFANFRRLLRSFLQHQGLPFAEALSEETIRQAFADENVNFAQEEGDVYTPPLTLWAFLSQVLFQKQQRSCMAAVARVVVLLVALGREPCSGNTGAYCRARAKIPVVVLRRLTLQVADTCEQQVPQHWLWKNRHVHLVDGATVSTPDTPANQAVWPQPATQKPGLGFPLIRMVVLVSVATAMITGMEMGPYQGKKTGETALLRALFDRLHAGDVVVADRYYCSYFMVALLRELGVDIVVRLHQLRDADFRRGRRLGLGDHIVEWLRPARPDWMDAETYARMPATLAVRQVRVSVKQPGFRVQEFVVVTSLLDADAFTQQDIAELYHQRWRVELDIRTLKITLGMDVLRCKSPEMVRREIWASLLAYNLIRQTMLPAALAADVSPRELSFTAALQKIAASWNTLGVADDAAAVVMIDVHLRHLAGNRVGNRPNRVEPRANKRRPKAQKFLTQPRSQARAALMAGAAE